MKDPRTSKTVWLGAATAALGLAILAVDILTYAASFHTQDTGYLVSREAAAVLLFVAGVLGIVLRFYTNQPLKSLRRTNDD